MTIFLEMMSYPFMVRAFIVGLLLSIAASLLGVTLVLKRYAMIGDGLSHVGFATLALASALNLPPLQLSLPLTVIASFFLLKINNHPKMQGDWAIAMISTASLAIGVMIVSLSTGLNTDVCNYLFGSVLAMKKSDVTISVICCLLVIIIYLLSYNKIFATTFDEAFAKATGINTNFYQLLIAFLTSIIVVLGMRMMGSLLLSSLIIFPTLTGLHFTKTFKSLTMISVLIAIVAFTIGLTSSYAFSTPSGATIAIVHLLFLSLAWIKGKITR